MGMLEGKTALITGGARGQGRAHALTCAREGADVVLVDITDPVATVPYETATAQDMEQTVKEVEAHDRRALAVTGDVRSQADLDAAVERGVGEFGKIDILIANAGIWGLKPLWEMDEATWSEMLDINLSGVFRSVRAVTPHMMERGTGSIVITSSINGLEPAQNYVHYVSAKHGLIGLMKNVALELAPYGVRANAISPGAIDTPMTDHQTAYDMFAGHEGGTREERYEGAYGFHALKGAGFLPAQAIADTALYLNSDLAAAVTGVVIPVDAGHMVLPGMNPAPAR
ncbi:mycofactocin-coupled SDR family oxidoreductase [Pseudonocardia sp.]|uniref:mycofactocin-coupled SDR family oxidoreductase n=1 Tax=Pseudonocardia sp. TaxID=60912 RepID=UPI002635FC2F|nr:mycofactocin-coupled SDR family oxidoreductase [Pseudonocardia sp.]